MLEPPKDLKDILYGTELHAGLGTSTVTADFDFETYSPAGFVWDETANEWKAPDGARDKKGLFAVGAAVYTKHPDAEVLCLAYDLKNGSGKQLWTPGSDLPSVLFHHLYCGGLIEAWNVSFEAWVWENICVPRYGFPSLKPYYSQLRCAMAKARAFSLPGSLDKAGEVLNTDAKKDRDGKRLLNKFSIPRDPTVNDPRLRTSPWDDIEDAKLLYDYCLQDIATEAEISSKVPDLSDFELEFWQCDQAINRRGVQVDLDSARNCIKIVKQAHEKYNAELQSLTGGAIESASKVQQLVKWAEEQGVELDGLTKKSVADALERNDIPELVRRALEIRQTIGSAAVKKLYMMINTATQEGRVHDLFIYHKARTGRAAGAGVQPQNMPNSGPEVRQCLYPGCKKHYGGNIDTCPWCGVTCEAVQATTCQTVEWNENAVNDAFETIATGDLNAVEYVWGDAMPAVSGCLRSLFTAAPGKDLICSDYSAIEAVVLAALSGEEWRLEVFRTHGKIYEASAAKISGVPLETILQHKTDTGQHHPLRKKLGKVAELASGYQGAIGAWKMFGASEHLTDDEINVAVKAWRAASPKIVAMWKNVENAAKSAILNPGRHYDVNGVSYTCVNKILYCTLPSGRKMAYQDAKLVPGRFGDQVSYMTWNTNRNQGAFGWVRITTYGGRLTENIVQAVARDILAFAIVNLERAEYPVVLHVHDEVVSEVPEVFGSVTEFESILNTMPDFARDWPLKASGGWRGKRYRK